MSRWVWIDRAVILAIHDMQLAEHGGGVGVRDERPSPPESGQGQRRDPRQEEEPVRNRGEQRERARVGSWGHRKAGYRAPHVALVTRGAARVAPR